MSFNDSINQINPSQEWKGFHMILHAKYFGVSCQNIIIDFNSFHQRINWCDACIGITSHQIKGVMRGHWFFDVEHWHHIRKQCTMILLHPFVLLSNTMDQLFDAMHWYWINVHLKKVLLETGRIIWEKTFWATKIVFVGMAQGSKKQSECQQFYYSLLEPTR